MKELFDWRTCYYIGGALGLTLLLLRMQVKESVLFKQVKQAGVKRGDFLMFFNNKERALLYLRCIMIGIPAWYIIGVLVTFSDQFGKEFGIEGIDPGKAIMYQYMAIAFGDLTAGLLSKLLNSRKKALFVFYGITTLFLGLYFGLRGGGSAQNMYWLCAGLGFGTGFSVIYITMSAEQFGTNLRATAAVTIPNMVRGALPLIIILFKGMRNWTGSYVTGAVLTGALLMLIAVYAAIGIRETYNKELDFVEV
jgi:hypothetical protein